MAEVQQILRRLATLLTILARLVSRVTAIAPGSRGDRI
jgi:hypothetical protein